MAVYIGSTSGGKKTKLSKLKGGDIFKKVGGKTEYIYNAKVRGYDGKKFVGFVFTYYNNPHLFDPKYLKISKDDMDVLLIERIIPKRGYALGVKKRY